MKNEQIAVKGLNEKVDIRIKDLIKDETILAEMVNKHSTLLRKRQE